jgi:hypothetical protein
LRPTATVLTLLLAGCAPRAGEVPAEPPSSLAARREIWAAVQPLAARQGLDPGFVYALVKIESNFDPHAHRGEARGLLQLKPPAWQAVSALPYATQVWDWRTNLAVGIDALAGTKAALERKGVFSYPVLWACYHYGYDFVAARGFDLSRVPRPSDPVSRRLRSGEVHPVPPPP